MKLTSDLVLCSLPRLAACNLEEVGELDGVGGRNEHHWVSTYNGFSVHIAYSPISEYLFNMTA